MVKDLRKEMQQKPWSETFNIMKNLQRGDNTVNNVLEHLLQHHAFWYAARVGCISEKKIWFSITRRSTGNVAYD